MNEQIQKLLNVCGMPNEDLMDIYSDTNKSFYMQKFAELIVEECRTVVNELYHKTPLELCGPLLTADEEIAKHFYGVEE